MPALTTCIVVAGCTSSQTTVASVDSDRISSFETRIKVNWPGEPRDSFRKMPWGTRRYMAVFNERNDIGGLSYNLIVEELAIGAVESKSPRETLEERLAESLDAIGAIETKRTTFEFGLRKLAALDFESAWESEGHMVYERTLMILDGDRLYTVEVSGRDKESLNADRAKAFFGSVRLPEN